MYSRTSCPPRLTLPDCTSQNRAIRLHSVVLPEPEGPTIVLHEVVSVGHARAVIVPIPCNELNAVFAWSTRQHRAAKVSKDAVVAIQPAGFELRGGFHSGHILQRFRGDVLDAI